MSSSELGRRCLRKHLGICPALVHSFSPAGLSAYHRRQSPLYLRLGQGPVKLYLLLARLQASDLYPTGSRAPAPAGPGCVLLVPCFCEAARRWRCLGQGSGLSRLEEPRLLEVGCRWELVRADWSRLGHTTSVSQTQEKDHQRYPWCHSLIPTVGWQTGSGSSGINKRSSQCLGCTTRQ